MKVRLTQQSYRLSSGELISLEQGAGWEVICHHGSAWLTMTGQPEDVYLHAGQRFAVTGNRKVVIEALGTGKAAHLSLSRLAG